MSELPRKAVRRTARLAALPLGYAGRTAVGLGRRLGGAPAEVVMTELQQRTAEQLFRTLGELKGGAMKFGQALSLLEAALPEELAAPYREQLTQLQDSAPPMPTITVREILGRELGPGWEQQLVDFDPEPAAAASIGQVHRGRWVDPASSTGTRDVAVKVQYPGAADALRSDLRQLSRVARSLGAAFPGIDVRALVTELAERAEEELDYELEAEAQRVFAAAYAADPDIVVPDVVAQGRQVLVTTWLESTGSLAQVIRSGTPAERTHYGERFIRFLFDSPARTGMLHADPHPGNYRLCGERLGVLDFGAVARLPERGLPRALGRLIRIASLDDYDELVGLLREEGFIRERIQVDPAGLRDYLAPFIEPLAAEQFTFSRAWMQEQFRRVNDPRSDVQRTMLRLNLPPSYLLIHRTWVGGVAVLSQLGATVNFRQILTESLPGFAD